MHKLSLILLLVGYWLQVAYLSPNNIPVEIHKEIQSNRFITVGFSCGSSGTVKTSPKPVDSTTKASSFVVLVENFRAKNYPTYCSAGAGDGNALYNMYCGTKLDPLQLELANTKIFTNILDEMGYKKTTLPNIVLGNSEEQDGCVERSDNTVVYHLKNRHPVAFGKVFLFKECNGNNGKVVIFEGKQRDNKIIKIVICQACYVHCSIDCNDAKEEHKILGYVIGFICFVLVPLFPIWYSFKTIWNRR